MANYIDVNVLVGRLELMTSIAEYCADTGRCPEHTAEVCAQTRRELQDIKLLIGEIDREPLSHGGAHGAAGGTSKA